MPARPAVPKGCSAIAVPSGLINPMPNRYSAMAMVKGMKVGAAANANMEDAASQRDEEADHAEVRWPQR